MRIERNIILNVGTPSDERMAWEEAKKYAESQGMRLPTRVESLFMIENKDELGIELPDWWWTCEMCHPEYIWKVSKAGGVDINNKERQYNVVPVEYIENKMEDFKITIPEVTDAKVKVFVGDEFIGEATCEQVNKIRINIIKHILKTKDKSILDKFYLIGHTDNNIRMGEEIKITMDEVGNLSDVPWELSHTRRDMLYLIDLEHKGLAHCELHYGR